MNPPNCALLTDLYQLTMAQAYHRLGMRETAVFELFVRRLPPTRRFLIAAGIEQSLQFLESLQFSPDDLRYLADLGLFPAEFLQDLAQVRFTGSVHAMPEGTPFFADEPVVRITAPILEAQLVESRLLNLVHFQTMIASKAMRCVIAARGKRLVDFGMRRAHGAEAALYAARAAYLAGFDATATVESGRQFGIPLSGTMAHSFIQAQDDEESAFRRFIEARARPTAVLIDTYDTQRAAHRVVTLANELKAAGAPGRIQAVRIDSGDLAAQARAVRKILDDGNCPEIEIVLSGSLDEIQIAALLDADVPVDAFGVGTRLDTSEDAPSLDMAYKLEDYAGKARRKRARGKETWPGAKQVFRERDAAGIFARDSIELTSEPGRGEPLLREMMRDGRRTAPTPTLDESRDLCRRQVAALPGAVRALTPGGDAYPVTIAGSVRSLALRLDATLE